jgi:hypothetical protein
MADKDQTIPEIFFWYHVIVNNSLRPKVMVLPMIFKQMDIVIRERYYSVALVVRQEIV